MQREGPLASALGREQIFLDQVIDRDRALMLDIGTGAADRFLIKSHRNDALGAIIVGRGFHYK